MSATIINFLIQIIAGAVGGNLSAKLKDFGLGPAAIPSAELLGVGSAARSSKP
jgi:hypothetical protein